MATVEFETTVKGGLPVIAHVYIEPAEREVGINYPSASLEGICWRSGKPVSEKVWDSIPKADLDRIEEEALGECNQFWLRTGRKPPVVYSEDGEAFWKYD